ncbi:MULTISPECIES: tripartite tricarboxylate transporter substrate binding protein [unclassified Beijerinckia]|uniref:Bug family tripartite tricarboxylate transporter substrate binding protein n=1 Tax=unclassified Beijerinckia TaxID=2638183 RepID=UPI00089B1105|nr:MULTISPECIES: tripartite tricarboxylate transporter substrate binding protein [unclassified Beijerinckia]MDH7794239.1 tripartite-type tricarboxylate transporter receptor subunit TctC [Beijerinckia sp. GAS462]SEB56566.1 Tripartite-type tricarboxylate transporter, receptor component TctC [Beijerinckia sp. 28-YEA-48]
MLIVRVITGLAMGLVATSGFAQDYPSANVRLIVNVAAGGVTDAVARVIGQGLFEKWGKPVIVENRVGANSAVAAQAVARAPADGHTLFVTADAPFTSTPFMVKELNFNVSEFAPIALICRLTPVIAVQASLKVKTLEEFLALAKSKPNVLNYGSQGLGTYGHLGMEDFMRRAGIRMTHVPYRGGAPAIEGLVRNDVNALIINYSNISPFEQSGDVVILAAASEKRASVRPNLPTVSESGVPGFSVSSWFGIFGPSQMPPNLINKIRDGVGEVLSNEKSSGFLGLNSCERETATPQEFARLIAADAEHWKAVIQSVGIKPE